MYGNSVGLAEILGRAEGAAEGRRLGAALTVGSLETLGAPLGGALVDGIGETVGFGVGAINEISNLGGKALSRL